MHVTRDELGQILGNLRNQKLRKGEIHSLHYTCAYIGTSFYAKHQIVVSTREAQHLSKLWYEPLTWEYLIIFLTYTRLKSNNQVEVDLASLSDNTQCLEYPRCQHVIRIKSKVNISHDTLI